MSIPEEPATPTPLTRPLSATLKVAVGLATPPQPTEESRRLVPILLQVFAEDLEAFVENDPTSFLVGYLLGFLEGSGRTVPFSKEDLARAIWDARVAAHQQLRHGT